VFLGTVGMLDFLLQSVRPIDDLEAVVLRSMPGMNYSFQTFLPVTKRDTSEMT
jgi:hypothetical protein